MKELLKKNKVSPTTIVLFGILFLYFVYICILNLSLNPSFYCTDMYSDALYAVRAWESKSIFPDGWVFGNQFYVIATPVLASLIYGIVGNFALAMAIASILMTIGIILSFLWMTKPVFHHIEERLIGILGFVVLTASAGNAITARNGWQIFFTMCSYYACYVITAFVCFGNFLRRREELTKPRIAMLVIALVLSFGSGMQSLRQTAIMLPSMLVIEGIYQLISLMKSKKLEVKPLIITASLSIANLSGRLVMHFLNVPQKEIFSYSRVLSTSEIAAAVKGSLTNMASLLTGKDNYNIILLLVLIVIIVAAIQLIRKKEERSISCSILIVLLLIGVLCIGILDTFTDMTVCNIHYFMIFPLVSVLFSYVYKYWDFGKIIIYVSLAVLVVFSLKNCVLPEVKTALKADTDFSYEISDMLIEKGYTTIYSGWNTCEDIAIASNGKITAGFWDGLNDVFRPVEYLCDPAVYETESDKCVYYLLNNNRDIALMLAAVRGAEMTLIAEYPERGIWIYEASENLMQTSLE